MPFERREKEKREIVTVEEVFQAEVSGFDVFLTRKGFGAADLDIARIGGGVGRGILRLNPRSVNDLKEWAALLPSLLLEIATGLNEAGLDDLRDPCEIDFERRREQWGEKAQG